MSALSRGEGQLAGTFQPEQSNVFYNDSKSENGEMGVTGRSSMPIIPTSEQSWFALTAKHQHEPTVARLLGAKGFEVFQPTYSEVRRWKDRKKVLKLPLFPGYVFFCGGLGRRVEILSTPGVFSIVAFGDTAAEISSEEIDAIRRATQHLEIQPHPFLTVGDRVRVVRGPLAGVSGILQKQKDTCRLVLSIELLGRSAAVEIDATIVERISVSQRRLGAQPWTEQALNLSN
jgi:transcription antitermination factor NusG